ncbi:hypothetical protein SUGI_0810640 [Cryptomeria japonica]|uniref:salutaridine reductase n=1 Tax=Cryptomeria japonica TaxID=3369 RepID=UPI002414C832|nr:salutaridine reductase [Cryptomeria japonica]GLJ39653.1 hypothetical protein SUGI_0810640 [Cryptomeria japonica]
MAFQKDETDSKWWTGETLAVVTGANKGIGFEIVRQLAENGLTVVLTARDEKRGLTARKTLVDQGFNNVVFRQLDIESPQSVSDFVRWLKDSYGGLDILVNNAAVMGSTINMEVVMNVVKDIDPTNVSFNHPSFAKIFITNYEMSKNCLEINYYGTKRITEALLPLFRKTPAGARIVNVSSEGGLVQWVRNDSLRMELSDISKITEEYIDKMIEGFLDDMKNGQLEGKGWPILNPQYCVSKLALNLYTRLLVQKLSVNEEKTIYVNNVHPGVVQTDMTNHLTGIAPSQGAENCVRLALFLPHGVSGQFYLMKEPHSF